jgi:diguanylate cyclase (GGDEF)-like protein
LALLYIDLDKFKAVNDTLGHNAGDELLKCVADRIRHALRESDTLARMGGDEFAVILPAITSREDVATVAAKIIGALSMSFILSGHAQEVTIGASMGIAIYPADAQDIDALIKAADAAMYNAKQVGNSFRFYELPRSP